MRSKIGTKTRLAAHILALVLLIVLLVYGSPAQPQQPPQLRPLRPSVSIPPRTESVTPPPVAAPAAGQEGTLDRIHTPQGVEATAPGELRPPQEAPAIPATAPEPPAEAQPIEPVPEAPAAPVEPEEPAAPAVGVSEEPADEPEPQESPAEESLTPPEEEPAAEPVSEPIAPEQPETEAEEAQPIAPEEPVEPAQPAVEPVQPQPDESGSLVVAASETGVDSPVRATTPLPENANLVVLGDGVYWLASRYNLEKELAAIPEIGSLVFLAPLPEYHSTGFEHVKTDVIPADLADLSTDAAEQYLQVVADEKRPVVTAVLPGARGAAFFKGAYLLANRKLEMPEVLRELEPELEEAGESRDDIVHRLMRLRDE